jgi:Na+/proline symporter
MITAGTLAPIDIAILVAFLVLVTVVGYVMSNAASEGVDDYFLGGNKIPWWVLGISTATSNFDMSGTMIIVAMVYELGYRGFLVELRGGVGLSLAFLMVFMGKWLRRSRVMTSAQYMRFRFGTKKPGQAAHIVSALAQSIMALGMIVYFCVGSGKFLQFFLPWNSQVCTAIMVAVGLSYTLMSGLYGVVFTDVLQMIILGITAIYISVKGFNVDVSQYVHLQGWHDLALTVPDEMKADLLKINPAFEFFGICILFYLFRTTLEGMGGVGGYTDQRFFAARNEREAGLLTMESIVISVLRWSMVAGLVALGYQMVAQALPETANSVAAIQSSAENVLPAVIASHIPVGFQGFVIAGLVAAAMSTFDSTLNAGASYLVVDIYKPYINPEATPEQMMKASHGATIGLAVVGALIGFSVNSIDAVWQYLTIALGPTMFIPLVLRWFWPRYNGWGFAWGTGASMAVAISLKAAISAKYLLWLSPMYYLFPIIFGTSLIASVVATLWTAPVEEKILMDFYMRVNPGGLWMPYATKAVEQKLMTREERAERALEKAYDLIATCMAVPFQFCLLVATMALVFHDWEKFAITGIITLCTGVGLYLFWFKNLKSVEKCAEEDERYGVFRA